MNLETIENNRALTINNQLRRLNPILFNELTRYNLNLEIINITNNSAQIRIEDNYSSSPDIENPTEDNIIETGEENLIFDFDDIITINFNTENIYLSSILQNRNLGLLQNTELKTIIKRILEINPHYNSTVVDLINTTENRIITNIHFGTGSITLTNNHENFIFNFTFVIPFSNLNSNLGDIDNNSHQAIARAFINANQGFNLNENDLLIRNVTPHSASIAHSHSESRPEFDTEVTFNAATIFLSSMNLNTNLGNINNNSHQAIARAFINANPNYQFNLQEVEVIDPTEISAIITINNNRYLGEINVFFSTKKRKLQNRTDCDYNPINYYYYNNLDYFFPYYDYNQYHLFQSRSNNQNILNRNKVYFKKENDYFQKWYRIDKDGLEPKLSLQTAVAIWKFVQNHNKSEIKAYLRNLITNVKQKNNSGAGGSISESDWDLMVDFICDGYLNFHQELLKWSKEINTNTNSNLKNDSIFIRTWRTYNWKDLSQQQQDSAFYISKDSKYNNREDEDELNKIELRASNPNTAEESNKDEKKIYSSNEPQKK